jgi:cellobiose transport system substrate-binding protein
LRRTRAVALAAVLALVATATAACSNGDDGLDANGNIVLTVKVFGGAGFGYDNLVKQYEKDHKGIKVKYQIVTDDYDNEFRPQMLQWLEAGSGAGDVVGIEEQGVGQMMSLSDAWADLSQYGLNSRKKDYPSWKWELGHTGDGKLAGLGTDVGGMAMCYRTDLFKKAGLPTDRDKVSRMWKDWDGFTKAGEKFVASGVKSAFVDSPNQLYNTRMIQEAGKADGISYFDRHDKYVLGKNKAVRTAFDYIKTLNSKKIIGKYQNLSDEWKKAMQADGFATMACPAWMMGVIKDTSGKSNAGKWDVATVPGGSGNWGGSWLGVPAQSKHPEEAAKLASYLTSTSSQVTAFEKISAFPSSVKGQKDPKVAKLSDKYFNDAPTGKIIGDSVRNFKPVYFGELHSAVRAAVEDVLFGMVQGTYSPSEAWPKFVKAGQKVVDTSQ